MKKEMVIYQAKNGAIEFRGDFTKDTIWATQAQIAQLFGIERSVITKHLRNIFRSKELNAISVCAKFAHTAGDGKIYQVEYYNLDAIISVGYRVNSKTATEFRKWATKTLREHITKGYTINKKQIAKNYDAFMEAVASVQNLLLEHVVLDPKIILELIKEFSSTWMSIDAYDKETLKPLGSTKKLSNFPGQNSKKLFRIYVLH